jgi:hypothetical protein
MTHGNLNSAGRRPLRLQLPTEVKTIEKTAIRTVCDDILRLLGSDSELSPVSGESDFSESEQTGSKCATTMSRLTGQSTTNTAQALLSEIAMMKRERENEMSMKRERENEMSMLNENVCLR